jgi:hypothetical protein
LFVTALLLSGIPAFGQGPSRRSLSDTGEWIVGLFGFLLCASAMFSLILIGMRAMFTGRYKPVKQKRGRQAR